MSIRNITLAFALSVAPVLAATPSTLAQEVSLSESQLTPAMQTALDEGGSLVLVDVLGAVCDFCALAMTRTFERRDEVAAATVDLDAKTLTFVVHEGQTLDDATITDLIRRAGYQANGITRPEAL
ncbi:heavy-metal-associated domain-containing protein [Glycocaulis abyssi]|uniref:Heavy-metal-associated domain-containing protein n=1 Tax=Glycocaulis abyssi TaxID=1433403 RepID=A0ABV9NH27_9PROT